MTKSDKWRKYLTILVVLSAVLTFLFTGLSIFFHWQINRDVDSWKYRAQVSNEPNMMVDWLLKVKSGLETRGWTSGNSNWILPTPENDMNLIYLTVENHIEQARRLTQMDRSSPEYQTGLDNLRGGIRELDLHTHERWNFRFPGIPIEVGKQISGLTLMVSLMAGFVVWLNWYLDKKYPSVKAKAQE